VPVNLYERTFALDDIVIRSGGGGRTVEAYATPFDTPTEIHDQHGDYIETVARTAFNRTLSHGIERVGVYYHHGMTLHGTPSDLGSVPVARPLEIQPDGRGLRTVSRYNKSALADAVLEAIRNGDVRGYSFRGRIYRSNPDRVPRVPRGGQLPVITRVELGLSEYGPTPTPYYDGAAIVAVRSAGQLAADIDHLPADARRELIRILSAPTPAVVPDALSATPTPGPGAADPHQVHSGRLDIRRARLRMEALRLGVLTNGTS
jgi:HK97 family phage prohead protease